MQVVYTGRSDVRILNPEDITRLLGRKMRHLKQPLVCLRNQPVEVSSAVGKMLLSHTELAGQFKAFDEPKEEPEEDQEPLPFNWLSLLNKSRPHHMLEALGSEGI